MTTIQDWVEQSKRYLLSGTQEELNVLSAGVDADDILLNLTYDPVGIARGALVSIGLEEMYVWSVADKVLTVQRGMNGSTAAAHGADALVNVRPKFSNFRIVAALNDELKDLSSPANGLFRVLETSYTYNVTTLGYDFTPTDFLGILDVRYSDVYGNGWYRVGRWEMQRNIGTTNTLLLDGGFPGREVIVTYRAPYADMTGLATSTDVTTTLGVQASVSDIPPIGAALRLVAPREIKRNFTEKAFEPRRSEEVPPGATTNSMRGLAILRSQRILAEATRLAQQYPSYRP